MQWTDLLLCSAALAGFTAQAGTMQVGALQTAALNSGDALEFQFQITNFQNISGELFPGRVSFIFDSAPVSGSAPVFDVSLQSVDGHTVVDFGASFTLQTGQMRTAAYAGPVSMMSGAMQLSSSDASALFGADGSAWAYLVIRNLNDPIMIGLPQHSLSQSGSVSLSDGRLSIGAAPGAVWLQSGQPMTQEASDQVPEPASAVLFGAGLAVVVWLARKQLTKLR